MKKFSTLLFAIVTFVSINSIAGWAKKIEVPCTMRQSDREAGGSLTVGLKFLKFNKNSGNYEDATGLSFPVEKYTVTNQDEQFTWEDLGISESDVPANFKERTYQYYNKAEKKYENRTSSDIRKILTGTMNIQINNIDNCSGERFQNEANVQDQTSVTLVGATLAPESKQLLELLKKVQQKNNRSGFSENRNFVAVQYISFENGRTVYIPSLLTNENQPDIRMNDWQVQTDIKVGLYADKTHQACVLSAIEWDDDSKPYVKFWDVIGTACPTDVDTSKDLSHPELYKEEKGIEFNSKENSKLLDIFKGFFSSDDSVIDDNTPLEPGIPSLDIGDDNIELTDEIEDSLGTGTSSVEDTATPSTDTTSSTPSSFWSAEDENVQFEYLPCKFKYSQNEQLLDFEAGDFDAVGIEVKQTVYDKKGKVSSSGCYYNPEKKKLFFPVVDSKDALSSLRTKSSYTVRSYTLEELKGWSRSKSLSLDSFGIRTVGDFIEIGELALMKSDGKLISVTKENLKLSNIITVGDGIFNLIFDFNMDAAQKTKSASTNTSSSAISRSVSSTNPSPSPSATNTTGSNNLVSDDEIDLNLTAAEEAEAESRVKEIDNDIASGFFDSKDFITGEEDDKNGVLLPNLEKDTAELVEKNNQEKVNCQYLSGHNGKMYFFAFSPEEDLKFYLYDLRSDTEDCYYKASEKKLYITADIENVQYKKGSSIEDFSSFNKKDLKFQEGIDFISVFHEKFTKGLANEYLKIGPHGNAFYITNQSDQIKKDFILKEIKEIKDLKRVTFIFDVEKKSNVRFKRSKMEGIEKEINELEKLNKISLVGEQDLPGDNHPLEGISLQ